MDVPPIGSVKLLEGLDPLEVDVRIVFPGIPHAPMQLDGLAGHEASGRSRPGLGDGDQVVGIVLAVLFRPGGTKSGGSCAF